MMEIGWMLFSACCLALAAWLYRQWSQSMEAVKELRECLHQTVREKLDLERELREWKRNGAEAKKR